METGAGGETLIHIPLTVTVEPVEVPPEEVTEAIRRLAREARLSGSPRETVERLFQLDALYGDYLYLLRERRLVPQESGTPLDGALTEEEQQLDLRGRYLWAMALSKSPVLEEFEKALGEMVSMQAVMQAAIGRPEARASVGSSSARWSLFRAGSQGRRVQLGPGARASDSAASAMLARVR